MIFQYFTFPKLSHPDPSVDRRSGFLTPSFTDTKKSRFRIINTILLGYSGNRDFTFTNKIYADENPLFFGRVSTCF